MTRRRLVSIGSSEYHPRHHHPHPQRNLPLCRYQVDETPGGYRRYTINVQIVTETVAGTPSWNPGNAFTSSGSLVDLSNGRAKSGSWNCVNTATSKTEKNGEKITYVG